ncbi:MAG: ComEC family competence protein [Flavobacteriales bacterium]|nr:ComEC family competence protein [Flavobacteriales bacterium]
MSNDPWSDVVRAPGLRAVLPFIGGLVVARLGAPDPATAWALCSGAFVVFAAMAVRRTQYKWRWVSGVAFLLFSLSFGVLFQTMRAPSNHPHRLVVDADQRRALLVEVSEVTGISPKVVRCRAEALGWVDSTGSAVARGGVLLMIRRDSVATTLRAGDRLVLRAPVNGIDRVADPGGFDRAQWAASQGIFHEAFVESGNWLRIGHEPQLAGLFNEWRANVSGWFDSLDLAPTEKGLVKALVLGVRNDIDMEQRDAFAKSGTMHVLAVSGMHVGLIYWILMQLMGWWGKKWWARVTRGVLIVASLWAFSGVAGGSPSIVRAALMFSVFTVAEVCGRPNEPLNSLSVAAFVLLLWDPSMIIQLSFLLSFMAVLGIILFYKPFMRLWSPPNAVLHFMWSAACVTMAAQLMTTPLSLWAFGAFPTWFLPANLIVVTASTGAVIVGIAALILGHVPWIGDAVEWLLSKLLWVMGEGAQWFGELPGSYPAVRMDTTQCVLMYGLILILSAIVAWRWWRLKWLLALSVGALLFTWHTRLRSTAGQRAFVVYDYRDGVLAGMVHGRELVVLADSANARDGYARRRVEAHARKWGLGSTMELAPSMMHEPRTGSTGSTVHGLGLWANDALCVRFLRSGSEVHGRSMNSSGLDAVVLQGPGRFDIDAIASAHHPQRVVLAPDMELSSLRYVRRWCEDHDVYCHDIRRQGAFILER